MKITKENFHEVEGKKIRRAIWSDKDEYFVPRFRDSSGDMFGMTKDCVGTDYPSHHLDWEFYTEPKKKVKLYPALYRRLDNKRFWLTQELYSSLTEALEAAKGKVLSDCITWPVESICVEVEE